MIRLIVFITLLLILFVYATCVKRSIYIFITGFFLFLLAGFRSWRVGTDTPDYHWMYNVLHTTTVTEVFTHMEKGFLYFNKCLLLLSDNSQFLLFTSSAIIVGSVFLCFYKYSRYAALSTFLYAVDLYFFHLTGMRQGLAMAILMFTIPLVQQRRWIWFLTLVSLAATFHHSALLFLAVYPISKKTLTPKTIGITILVSFLCIWLFPLFSQIVFKVFPDYQAYTESVWFGNDVKLASIMKILISASIFFFSWITWRKLSSKLQDENHLFINLSLLGLCIMLISIKATVLERAAFYFTFFNTILLPNMVICYSKNVQYLITLVIIVLFILYALITTFLRPDWMGVIPYTFYWEI